MFFNTTAFARVFLDCLVDPVERIVRGVVCQHVEDEALLDGLLHRVDMERLALTLGVHAPEKLDGRRLRRGGEGEHGNVRLLAVSLDLVHDYVFDVALDALAASERLRDRRHVLASGRGVCLIDDDRETLTLKPLHAVDDVGEFLDCRGDDLRVAVQCDSEVGRVALVVHDADETGLVLQPQDGLLQLAVYNHAVCHDDHVIEDDLVVGVMQRGEPVRQPCDGVGLARTCAMLDEIVLRRPVLGHVVEELSNDVELVVAREDDILLLARLACQLVDLLLGFDKDEASDEVEDSVLLQNVLPHVGHAVAVFERGVARTRVHALSATHVEGQEVR